MNIGRVALVLTLGLLATVRPDDAFAAEGEARKEAEVTLKRRKDNKAYGEAAYSFRQATHDLAVHRNYVDLVLNGCGQLHVAPVNGAQSKVTDLGAAELQKAPDEAPADAKWMGRSIRPEAGHVYLIDINENQQRMTVKFRVRR